MTSSKQMLGLFVFFALLLVVSACSKSAEEKAEATLSEARIADGETVLINSAKPFWDKSIGANITFVVADRIERKKSAVELYVSGESNPDLHAILSENVGKRVRVQLRENEIVAVEEPDGKRRFAAAADGDNNFADIGSDQAMPISQGQSAEDMQPPYGWNFLLGHCFYKGEDLQKCDESSARRGSAAGTYDVFGESQIDMYTFDPVSIPLQFRRDTHVVAENVQYQYDKATNGVIVRVTTPDGCVMPSLYVQASRWTVNQQFLDISGTCTDMQRQIHEQLQSIQKKNGPLILYPATRGGLVSVQ